MSNRTKFGKTKDVSEPYATFKNPQGWEWRVLKTYQSVKKECDISMHDGLLQLSHLLRMIAGSMVIHM